MSAPLPPLGGAPRPQAPGRQQRGLIAAIACIALFGVSQGMTHPLFALKLEQAGWSSAMIGLNGAMVAVAALTLGPLMPRLIRLLGLPGFLTAGALLSSATLLLFPLFETYAAWLVLRYVQGAAATMLFLGSENWIVADADESSRGRVVGLYATVLSLGFASGPLILTGVGFEGWTPFVACSALGLVCIVPLLTAWADAPNAEPDDVSDIAPLSFLRTDPTVLFAVVLFGAVEFGAMALLPVWGVKTGMERDAATFLVSVLILGNVVFQIPLGALADRWNRRALLIFCAAVTLAMAAALPALAGTVWPLWASLFIWGGLAAGLYTVALIELGARYKGARLVSATAAVVSAYGIGALAGPLMVGAAMDAVEPHGLSISLGAMAAAYLGLALWRARRGGSARGA
ncbi:MAG: MFS transporter [Rubrimonas sp.]|uniref:MFS transporter n=1 Tax=Rubrimonas sp. TaxID=2036015 RepID=UPI002FDCC20E